MPAAGSKISNCQMRSDYKYNIDARVTKPRDKTLKSSTTE